MACNRSLPSVTPFLRNAFSQATRRQLRHASASASVATAKREGDISDAFASMSGQDFKPLDQRYAALKARLIDGRHDAIRASWNRLLTALRAEVPLIAAKGPSIVPEIDFRELEHPSEEFVSEHRKRGVAVIRNVIPEQTALGYKEDVRSYLKQNPHTKAFPPHDPQVYELYWSPAQIRARAHPNLLAAQKFLMSFWHAPPSAPVSTSHPLSYADRLRMRRPGDVNFALGPHVDGGSVERWEEGGYGLGGVYDRIWEGRWEEYDPWEASSRLPVKSDLYQGAGACSMFRMYQGWLAMSETGPGEGTLLVNPLLSMATSYILLRPFFSAKQSGGSLSTEDFLAPENWELEDASTSWVQGATPGFGQEVRDILHPHLQLPLSMVHMPTVRPGDYVAWHCDTIHAVDPIHGGSKDASVMYIPACPLTEHNAKYMARQRDAFVAGTPGPDFPGGEGESNHVGRPTVPQAVGMGEAEGARAFGLEKWDSAANGLTPGQAEVMDRANKALGFYL